MEGRYTTLIIVYNMNDRANQISESVNCVCLSQQELLYQPNMPLSLVTSYLYT